MMYATILVIPLLLVGTSSVQYSDSSTWNPITSRMSPSRTPIPIPFEATNSPSYKFCGHRKKCVRTFLCSTPSLVYKESDVCAFAETCCSIDNVVEDPTLSPSPNTAHTGCGYRNVAGVGFATTRASAKEAKFGEFPWMVAILREEQVLDLIVNLYHSGGSLIAPHIVLTAAHSVDDWPSKSLKVCAGKWEVKSKREPYPTQDRYVAEKIVHENFKKDILHNDGALLVLEKPFDLAPNVNTICLPPAGYNFDYSRCVSTGWGKDKFEKGQYVNVLKKIDSSAVQRAQCEVNLRQTRLSKYFELHSSFMCAGGESGTDVCTGDGGSPLICPIAGQVDRYYQAGIVAWGIGCGVVNVPGVYVSVENLRGWLDQKLTHEGVPSEYYTAS